MTTGMCGHIHLFSLDRQWIHVHASVPVVSGPPFHEPLYLAAQEKLDLLGDELRKMVSLSATVSLWIHVHVSVHEAFAVFLTFST